MSWCRQPGLLCITAGRAGGRHIHCSSPCRPPRSCCSHSTQARRCRCATLPRRAAGLQAEDPPGRTKAACPAHRAPPSRGSGRCARPRQHASKGGGSSGNCGGGGGGGGLPGSRRLLCSCYVCGAAPNRPLHGRPTCFPCPRFGRTTCFPCSSLPRRGGGGRGCDWCIGGGNRTRKPHSRLE